MPGNNSTITTTPANGTVNGNLPGGINLGSARIEQGPDWLVDFYLSPPGWVNPLLKIVAVIAVVIVVYRLYQWDGEVPLDVQREMQTIAGTVVAIVTATLAFVNLGPFAYWVDVTGGFLLGYGTVFALQQPRVARRLPGPTHPRERVAAAWLAIAVCAIFLPELVLTEGVGISLTKSRYILTGIATVMLVLNARELSVSGSESV
jgi:hypothetical protein